MTRIERLPVGRQGYTQIFFCPASRQAGLQKIWIASVILDLAKQDNPVLSQSKHYPILKTGHLFSESY